MKVRDLIKHLSLLINRDENPDVIFKTNEGYSVVDWELKEEALILFFEKEYVRELTMDLIKTKFSSEINAMLEDAIRHFIDKKGFEAIFQSLKNRIDDDC